MQLFSIPITFCWLTNKYRAVSSQYAVVSSEIVLNEIIDVDHKNASAVHTFKSKINFCDFAPVCNATDQIGLEWIEFDLVAKKEMNEK